MTDAFKPRRTAALIAMLAVSALGLAACGGSSDSNSSSSSGSGSADTKKTLSLVAYSTPEVVYDQVIPAFNKTPAGTGIGFKTSYGASGEQSRAVEAGLKADVVTFSLAPDVDRLVKAKLVSKEWTSATPTKGLVTTSLVSFVVRKGNPKGIKSWDDLLKPGVKVITPNPFTSGAAKWNLLGAYQHGGLRFVKELITKHVPVQPKSGREALQTFTGGEGDVLISYEYEYATAVKKGEKNLQLVQPQDTIKIENPNAVTTSADPSAKAFVDFAISPPAQQLFADWGYRPVDAATLAANKAKFPDPKKVVTIDSLGGWKKLNTDLFDPEKGSVAKIESDAGVSTAK
jgi:sulfate transport system substrate-binding protein